MRRHVVNALLLIALSLLIPECARAALPYLDITSDVQRPDEEFVIKRVYSGNTPLIRWTATDDSVASKQADLDGWSFVLWYAADNSATSGWFVAQSSVASNQVVFSSITNFFAIPNDNYYVSIKGIHQSGWVRTWGVGRMNQKWDFATGNPYTNTQGILNTTQLNWSVFASYSGAWPFYAGSNITLTSSSTGLVISASATGGDSASGSITQGQYNAVLGGLTVSNSLTFSTNAAQSSAVGATYWDITNKTLSTVLDASVILQHGQELHVYGQNKTGITISNGQPVKLVADTGNNVRFDFASSTNAVGMGHVVGIATETISNNQSGYVTAFGIVRGVNTSPWNNGDDLYLDGDGKLTNAVPMPPAKPTHVGYVIFAGVNGSIFAQCGSPESDPSWATSSNTVMSGIVTSVLTASGASNGVALSSNRITVTFSTNAAAAGTLSGAYSTSALLTLAVSGTNIVGGLSSSVATGTPIYVESDPLFAAASNALMQATGTSARVQFGQFVVNTNKITLDANATSFAIYAGEERGLGQGNVGASIIGYRTNNPSVPGAITISTPSSTGYVGISAGQYVAIENTRFDTDAISNAAGTITIGKIQMPQWTTGSVPLSAGFTNVVTINDAQGQGAINQYWGRLDFRSYWAPPFMVYRLTSNTDANAYIAQSWWSYNGSYTSAIPSNHSVYVTMGPHTATKAINAVGIGSIARGTNDGMHDLRLMTSDSATNLAERARLTSEGDFRLNGGKYYGDGSQLTNLPASGASSNPFTNFYVNAVASPTNRFQFTVPTNELWSRIEINLTAYQTNDAAAGFIYFRINGATGTNALHSYQLETFTHSSMTSASGSNDATGAYGGRFNAPHNYSNAACRATINLNDIYDTYPAKTYSTRVWNKLRTVGGLYTQFTELIDGSVSIGAVVTGVEVLAIGTLFDTGTVLRVRGMP